MFDIVTGERFQRLANVYLGLAEDFEYNPLIKTDINKHKNLDTIVLPYDNPKIIFCYSHRLQLLSKKINFFTNKFVLITHNSDGNISNTTEIQTILNCAKLIVWYGQNVLMKHVKLNFIPIGMANSMWVHGDISCFKTLKIVKQSKVYMCFQINTNKNIRESCYNLLKHKLPLLPIISHNDNITRLSSYEFSICPEGNGVDTHRFWESLYTKTVPIVMNNMLIQTIMETTNIPMVILNSWDEFNVNNLNYNNYDFDNIDHIQFSYYKDIIYKYQCADI